MNLRTVLSAAMAAALVAAAPAHAEIRSATVTDPVGDSAGAPSQDILSATASYDTNGQVTITATMNGDIASGPDSFFTTRIASFAPPASCMGASVSIFGFYTSEYPSLMISGVSGVGDAYKNVTGATIGLSRSLSQLANKDWSCMEFTVTPRGEGGNTLDKLDVPLFFDGYGPDTDGDGLKDNRDKCPTEAGAGTADGCPVKAVVTPQQPQQTQQTQPGPVATTPAVTVKKSVPPACKKLTGKKRAVCIKRQTALAKCKKIKASKKRAACIKKAKKIKK